MFTIFADDIVRVAHLLIFKSISLSNLKHGPTGREKHLQEEMVFRYFSGVKVIYNYNAYASKEFILMWFKEILMPN